MDHSGGHPVCTHPGLCCSRTGRGQQGAAQQGVVWRHQPWQTRQSDTSGGWGGLRWPRGMGAWRGTKADPTVLGGPGAQTPLCPQGLGRPGHQHTAVHPAGAQAGAEGEGGRQAGPGRAGRRQQHSTQQARPPTAGRGPLPTAGPREPSAPGSPPRSGLSCFKDKGFRTWGQVLTQGLDLWGHPTLAVRGTFWVCSPLRFSCVFLITSSKPPGGGISTPTVWIRTLRT